MDINFIKKEYWFCNVSLNRYCTFVQENIKPIKVWAVKTDSTLVLYKSKKGNTYCDMLVFKIFGTKYSNLSINYRWSNGELIIKEHLAETLEESKKLYNNQLDDCIKKLLDSKENNINRRISLLNNQLKKYSSSKINFNKIEYLQEKDFKSLVEDDNKVYYLINYVPSLKRSPYKYYYNKYSYYECGIRCIFKKDSDEEFHFSDPYSGIITSMDVIVEGKKTRETVFLKSDCLDRWKNYVFSDKDSALNVYRKQINEGFNRLSDELDNEINKLESNRYLLAL